MLTVLVNDYIRDDHYGDYLGKFKIKCVLANYCIYYNSLCHGRLGRALTGIAAWLCLATMACGRSGAGGDADVWRFLLLSGPVACLVAPTLGVMVLYGIGTLAQEDIGTQWLAWWAGDTLGVLLFGPLFMYVWRSDRSFWPRARIQVAVPLHITAILLAADYLGLQQHGEGQSRNEVETRIEDVYDDTFLPLNTVNKPLMGIERFFAASEDVNRQEFATYTKCVLLQPGIIATEWAPRITQTERGVFESTNHVQISERIVNGHLVGAGERSAYFPVIFVEPLAENEYVMGYDLISHSSRETAMERARDTGITVASESIVLIQTGQPGLLIFSPVYNHHFDVEHASIESRREALRGFVLGVFDIEKLFAAFTERAHADTLLYRVTDITPGEPQHVLVGTLLSEVPASWMRKVDFAGRIWQVEMQPAITYWQASQSFDERFFLIFL